MKARKINLYLFATILTLSVSSFLASYLLLDEILDSAIALGVNPKMSRLMADYQNDLKKLKQLDSINEQVYKSKFYHVQEAMVVYQNTDQLVPIVKSSYLAYFLVIFLSILVISIAAAMLLSRKVSYSYTQLFNRDIDKSKRLQELEYFDNWQRIAASLAHEIKNPLTPIEMMVNNLSQAYSDESQVVFEKKLKLTQKIVFEEVTRLKNMVNHFGRFSKLPEARLEPVDFIAFVSQVIEGFRTTWNDLNIDFEKKDELESIELYIDRFLFKQCLLNLVQNALEANPLITQQKITIRMILVDRQKVELYFANIGQTLNQEQREKIFQFGFSTKSSNTNQGLGLSIVKKIILDHQGEIIALP